MSDVNESNYREQQSNPQAGGPAPQGPPPGGGWGPSPPMPERKNPTLAGILSCIMPGAGQFYIGYVQRGFGFLAAFAIPITLLSNNVMYGLEPFLGIFLAYVWIFGIIDANRRAKAYNLALAGGSNPELPSELSLPEGKGSKIWGMVLVVCGLILFLNTKFDLTLEWIEEFWPLGLVLLGANLIYKSRRAEQKEIGERSSF